MTAPEDEYVDPDEDDDDAEDDDDEDADPEHEEGRLWPLISETSDSITRAMQIGRNKTLQGCLVRVETYGSEDGEYASSTIFVPAVTISDLQFETHPEPDAESGSSSS